MHLSLRRSVVALGIVGLAAIAAPAAIAHDVVLGGNPADGETVEQFPEEVVLEFSGIPKEGFNTLAITEAETGEVLFTGEPTVDDRNVIIQVPTEVNPGPGDYRIGFQITSSDGHSTRGMTTFTVAGDSASTPAPAAPAAPAEQAEEAQPGDLDGLSTGAKVAIALGAVLALVAAAAAAIVRNRKRNELDER